MTWLREDAKRIAADLEDGSILADDDLGVLALLIGLVDTQSDQALTLDDDFTVVGAERLIDEHGYDADELYDRAHSIARNMTSGAVILKGEGDYPAGLMRMEHPPNVLYVSGDASLLSTSLIAVVGARRINAEQEAAIADLGRAVGPLVSGCAPGTDAVAMTASLDDGKPVVAVLGCGINYAFGLHDISLVQRVEREGLVVSEYPLSTPPVAHRLLRRNEIIAGLSETFIVCAAEFKSGSYSGLRRAEKMGVPILAMPGTPALDDWLSRNPERQVTQIALFPKGDEGAENDLDTLDLPEFEQNPWVEARLASARSWATVEESLRAMYTGA